MRLPKETARSEEGQGDPGGTPTLKGRLTDNESAMENLKRAAMKVGGEPEIGGFSESKECP